VILSAALAFTGRALAGHALSAAFLVSDLAGNGGDLEIPAANPAIHVVLDVSESLISVPIGRVIDLDPSGPEVPRAFAADKVGIGLIRLH
jgi:hypothetical protein